MNKVKTSTKSHKTKINERKAKKAIGTQPKIDSMDASMKPHSYATWLIILMQFIFWPVGLYFMWRNKKFSLGARILISAVFLVLTILFVVTNLDA